MSNFLHIVRSSRKASITSLFLQVLDNLSRADQDNLIPIVDFVNPKLLVYDEKYGKNVWEYYFHPVSNVSINDLTDKDKKIRSSKMSFPQHLNYNFGAAATNKSYMKKFKERKVPNFDRKHREHFNNIIKKYVKIKKYILEEEHDFYSSYMKNKKLIGVFVRATNKYWNTNTGTLNGRMFPIEGYIEKTKKYFKEENYDGIFVASDNHEAIDTFKKEFGDKIVYNNNVMRFEKYNSKSDPPWEDPSYGPMGEKTKGDMGKENIIETLLLSKCDMLIHTEGNIAVAAMLYNPIMKHKFIL